MRFVYGQVFKEQHPYHFLDNARENTEWQHAGQHPLDVCVLNAGTEPPPSEPAEDTPQEILQCPGTHQKEETDLIAPVAHAHPFLNSEHNAEQDGPANEDRRMHKCRLNLVLPQIKKFQKFCLDFLSSEDESLIALGMRGQTARLKPHYRPDSHAAIRLHSIVKGASIILAVCINKCKLNNVLVNALEHRNVASRHKNDYTWYEVAPLGGTGAGNCRKSVCQIVTGGAVSVTNSAPTVDRPES